MATIADVARESGLSSSTVSRALADHPHISEETKRRVRACAARLGYRPNRLARGLRAGRTRTIGLVVLDVGDPYYTEIAHGAEEAALRRGYMLILCNADNAAARAAAYVDLLADYRVDGLLITPADRPGQAAAAAQIRRVVLIDADGSAGAGIALSTVSVDHEQGARIAMEHLIALGHRRIAFVNWTLEAPHCAAAQRGVEAVLASRAMPWDPALSRVVARPHPRDTADATSELLALPDPPTAIFAYGDLMAYGALTAAQAAGMDVPRDLSIVGYDDIPLARHLIPPLTTVRQDTYEIGRRAAEILIEEIEGREIRQRVLLQAELRVRGSTAAPRATNRETAGAGVRTPHPPPSGSR